MYFVWFKFINLYRVRKSEIFCRIIEIGCDAFGKYYRIDF